MSRGSGLRITLATRRAIEALLAGPDGQIYATQICTETALASGTVYPMLARLERLGTQWEGTISTDAGRPRRYYKLTTGGSENVALTLTLTRVPVNAVSGLRIRPVCAPAAAVAKAPARARTSIPHGQHRGSASRMTGGRQAAGGRRPAASRGVARRAVGARGNACRYQLAPAGSRDCRAGSLRPAVRPMSEDRAVRGGGIARNVPTMVKIT
jgi:PadR family transcriptional regulator PadR